MALTQKALLNNEHLEHRTWFTALNKLLNEVPSDTQLTRCYQNFSYEIKDKLSDFMIISAFSATPEAKKIVRCMASEKILQIALRSKSLAPFKTDSRFLAKLKVITVHIVNQAVIEEERFVKNRLFTLMPQETPCGAVKMLQETTYLSATTSWKIPNYIIDNDYLDNLTQWAESNKNIAKKMDLIAKTDPKKRKERAENAKRESLGKRYVWISFTFLLLCILLPILEIMKLTSYSLVASPFLFLLSAIYAVPAHKLISEPIDKFQNDWINSVDKFLELKFEEPKIAKKLEIRLKLTISPLNYVDYTTPNENKQTSPHQYRMIVDELDRNKKTVNPPAPHHTTEEKVETPASALYTDINSKNNFQLSFTHQNIRFHACLVEDALPEGDEGRAIKVAFNKGPLKSSSQRSAHAIVKAGRWDFCLFKIRTSYEGRMKSTTEIVDAKNINLVFDLYDPNSHDRKRRLKQGP